MSLFGPKHLADGVRTVRSNTILVAQETFDNLPAFLAKVVLS
jgi:hypothetical protein